MHCHLCQQPDSRVIDTRSTDDGRAIRRRRLCTSCGHRFSTVESSVLLVVKRSGVTEVFDLNKVISGARKACQGRPVASDDLAKIGHAVEEQFRAAGRTEVASDTIGLAVLPHLHQLDAVAYVTITALDDPGELVPVHQSFRDDALLWREPVPTVSET